MTLMLKRLNRKLKSMRKMLEIVFVEEVNPLTRGTNLKGQDLIRPLVKKSMFQHSTRGKVIDQMRKQLRILELCLEGQHYY